MVKEPVALADQARTLVAHLVDHQVILGRVVTGRVQLEKFLEAIEEMHRQARMADAQQ